MRRGLCLVVFVLAFAMPARAAVGIDAITNSGFVTSGTNTISHTTGGAATAMLVSCKYSDSAPLTSVTYDSVSMTLAGSIVSDNGLYTTVYKLTGPNTGTHNAVATLNSSQESDCIVATFTNTHVAVPFGTAVTDAYTSSGVTAHSHATTSQVDGLVWDAFVIDPGAGTVTSDGGQTDRAGPAESGLTYVDSTKPGAASVTTGYSWQNDFYRWSHVTVPIIPAAAASGSSSLMLSGVGR